MNRIIFALCGVLALSACSREEPTAKAPAEAPARITFSSPVKFSEDPKVRLGQQTAMVDSMIRDTHIDLATIEGEAYRRGVTLTPAQIAMKKSQVINRDGPHDLPVAEAAAANVSSPAS